MEGIQNIHQGFVQLLPRAICGVLLQHGNGQGFNVLQPRENKREFNQLAYDVSTEPIPFL